MKDSIIEKLGVTPGPWKHVSRYNRREDDGYVGDGSISSPLYFIACMEDQLCHMQDAKIIAAAPEMLEALIDSALYIEMKIGGRKCNHTIDICYCEDMEYLSKCIIAIEKATGKTWEDIKEIL